MPELATRSALLTGEQRELRAAVQSFTARHLSDEQLRAQVEAPEHFDRALWQLMCEQLGVAAMALPESLGGFAATAVDLVVVAEELGSALSPQPFLPTVGFALGALSAADPAAAGDLVDQVVSGERILVAPAPDAPPVAARAANDGAGANTIVVDGSYRAMVNAGQSDCLLVWAQLPDRLVLALVDASAEGLLVEARPTMDDTRAQSRVELSSVPARVLLSGIDAERARERARALSMLLIAAEEVGVARSCLDLAVEYAGIREQFGRVIGSYQAIKHKCTRMVVALDLAQGAVLAAAQALDDADPQAAELVPMARHLSIEAAALNSRECIQIHGGIGFTWDHPAHRYFKRAGADQSLLGPVSRHLDDYYRAVTASSDAQNTGEAAAS